VGKLWPGEGNWTPSEPPPWEMEMWIKSGLPLLLAERLTTIRVGLHILNTRSGGRHTNSPRISRVTHL
jgi:hypothetical protein